MNEFLISCCIFRLYDLMENKNYITCYIGGDHDIFTNHLVVIKLTLLSSEKNYRCHNVLQEKKHFYQ